MIVFGAMYFIVPRLMDREWPRPALIHWHFWLALVGIAVYFLALTIGGWREGEYMLDPARPFADVVNVTKPYLIARSVGGTLMLLAHCVFGYHYWLMVRRRGPETAWTDGRAAG
jgi:cytochrome c oxidase cbb3-type subunit 1